MTTDSKSKSPATIVLGRGVHDHKIGNLRYALYDTAWLEFEHALARCVADAAVKRVCDVGGGAEPAVALDVVQRLGLEYLIIDISREELSKAPVGYMKLHADAASPEFSPPGRFDLVITKTVAEHIRDPAVFHRNIFNLLSDGGRGIHFFSTLYSLPFVVNRILPEAVTKAALRRVQPSRGLSEGAKFPAYYRWCRGPTRTQQMRFASLGFEIEEYVGFFGHDYYGSIAAADGVQRLLSRALLRRPLPWLTSLSLVVLRRPAR